MVGVGRPGLARATRLALSPGRLALVCTENPVCGLERARRCGEDAICFGLRLSAPSRPYTFLMMMILLPLGCSISMTSGCLLVLLLMRS